MGIKCCRSDAKKDVSIQNEVDISKIRRDTETTPWYSMIEIKPNIAIPADLYNQYEKGITIVNR